MSVSDFIPIIAIVGGLTIPIVALLTDYRRRQLQYAERRLMIEKGMQPPPLAEEGRDGMGRPTDLAARRERALQGGLTMLCIGLGLGLAAYLIGYVLTDNIVPRRIAGGMAIGACVTGFIGLGKLVYYFATRRRGEAGAPGLQ